MAPLYNFYISIIESVDSISRDDEWIVHMWQQELMSRRKLLVAVIGIFIENEHYSYHFLSAFSDFVRL